MYFIAIDVVLGTYLAFLDTLMQRPVIKALDMIEISPKLVRSGFNCTTAGSLRCL